MTVVMLTLLRDTETRGKPHSIKQAGETVTAEVGVVFTRNGERLLHRRLCGASDV